MGRGRQRTQSRAASNLMRKNLSGQNMQSETRRAARRDRRSESKTLRELRATDPLVWMPPPPTQLYAQHPIRKM